MCFTTKTTGVRNCYENVIERNLFALRTLDTVAEADTATGGVDRHDMIFPIIKIVTETGVETVTDDKLSELSRLKDHD